MGGGVKTPDELRATIDKAATLTTPVAIAIVIASVAATAIIGIYEELQRIDQRLEVIADGSRR
jgi:hypothetical protein